MQLGTLVTGVTYRNPALLAKIVTTLDVISKGRAVLGIGAAWFERGAHGARVRLPAGTRERMDRLEEAVQICRAMFRDEHPSFDGRYYRIVEARNVPRPIRSGGPPIMIGGSGEKRTLRLVAQYADMCNVTGGPSTLAHKLDVLRKHCTDVGRDPGEITTTRMGTLVLTPDRDETARVRSFLSGMMGDDFDEQFIVGEDAEVIAAVEELAATGVDTLIFNMPLSDADSVQRVGELLVRKFA